MDYIWLAHAIAIKTPQLAFEYVQFLESTEVNFREFTFLAHPSVPREVLWNKETVYFHDAARPFTPVYSTGAAVAVDGNLTQGRLQHSVADVAHARLLHFENLEPHTFAGFDEAQVPSFHAAI